MIFSVLSLGCVIVPAVRPVAFVISVMDLPIGFSLVEAKVSPEASISVAPKAYFAASKYADASFQFTAPSNVAFDTVLIWPTV